MRDHAIESEDWNEVRVVWKFPSDEALNEFLLTIAERDQSEINLVLNHLLIPSCALGKDHMNYELYLDSMKREEPEWQRYRDHMSRSWHFQRVLGYYSGITDDLPWEGVKWIRQLLPDNPRVALAAIDAYFLAHMRDMTDSLIHAMSDAEAIIRARYIGIPASQKMRRQELYELNSRQFERLVERLFSNMGYETELTPLRGDGGRDVIARRTEPGNQQHVLIECKRHERKIGVKDVRALLGIVSNEHASRGTIVAASHFTKGAKKLAQENHRIELIDGLRLVVMLNEHLGWTWQSRLDRLTSERNALAQST